MSNPSNAGTTPADGPLHGLRVLDCSTILAGPLCAQMLGDYGAEVIKVEHPQAGDGMRGHGPSKDGEPLWWKEISRNKQGLALKLSEPDGAEILLKLAETADVLVENFRPGTFEKWGLGPEVLHARNPRLVIVRITGFGQHGPYAHRAGFGTLAEAMSGFAHLTGPADRPPSLPAFGLADSMCGIAAAAATAMALWHRDVAGGGGQVIDMNLLLPLMTAVGPGPTVYDQLGVVGERHGNRSTNNAPRNTYLTCDGKWVAVSTSAQAIAERVLRLVGHPEVIDEPWFASGATRVEHVDELDEYVGSWIGRRTRAEVLAAFEDAGAAIAPVYDVRDIVEDEHVRTTQMLTTAKDEVLGDVLMHNVMWGMSATPGRIRHVGRPKGADTTAILTDAGYSPEQITDLRTRGVVA
jgi:crotonobetainyl-CoA:carnitine CoA-transferase CaiB-like acyl-CoA transferase